MSGSSVEEIMHPAGLSLPSWPPEPEDVDRTGTSFVVAAFGAGEGEAALIARRWAEQASLHASTTDLTFAEYDPQAWRSALQGARCGVRVMVVGSQSTVLLALAEARALGLSPAELRSFVTSTDDVAIYCAHCRRTSQVSGAPGDVVTCPGCARSLEIHPHLSAVRGSFLASDARAREIA